MSSFYAKRRPIGGYTRPTGGGPRGRVVAYMAAAGTKRGTTFLAKRFPTKRKASLSTQVRRLLKGQTKDAASVARSATLTTTTISLLTSSTAFATAAATTGLLSTQADAVTINSLTVRGTLELQTLEDVTPVGLASASVRTLIVWFYKPLLVASAAGTLPPITEVLESDAFDSLVVDDTRNSGRFTLLKDTTVNLGMATVAVAATGAYPVANGLRNYCEDFTVKIGKMVHFKGVPDAVVGDVGGHYDSDYSQGQIDKGLLIMYTLSQNAGTAGTIVVTRNTRINYTA